MLVHIVCQLRFTAKKQTESLDEFCRREQMQQKSGDACAGMPERRYGAKRAPALNLCSLDCHDETHGDPKSIAI